MSAKRGEMYRIRKGRARPLWAFGPEPASAHGQQDDFIMASVPDEGLVMFIEERRDRSGLLQWVKVIYEGDIGFLQCQFLSVGSLLDPSREGQEAFQLRPELQNPKSA